MYDLHGWVCLQYASQGPGDGGVSGVDPDPHPGTRLPVTTQCYTTEGTAYHLQNPIVDPLSPLSSELTNSYIQSEAYVRSR